VRTTLLGFRVVDATRVDVTFAVDAAAGEALNCDLRARNAAWETVGSARVKVPPGERSRREVTAGVRTRERAVTGEVQECRVVGH
jgi:hypothetical protein